MGMVARQSKSAVAVAVALAVATVCFLLPVTTHAQLQVGFYDTTCPNAPRRWSVRPSRRPSPGTPVLRPGSSASISTTVSSG
jgi:hypothetical protein